MNARAERLVAAIILIGVVALALIQFALKA